MNPSSRFRSINWPLTVIHFLASLLIVLSVQTFFYLHNLFLFEQLSVHWPAKTGAAFRDLEINGYDFGDLVMYKFYAVATSIPVAIIILVTTLLLRQKKIKGYWIGPMLVCLLIILVFRFSDYRFFYESILIWLSAKFGPGKALLFVMTGLLEFAGGVLIFLRAVFLSDRFLVSGHKSK